MCIRDRENPNKDLRSCSTGDLWLGPAATAVREIRGRELSRAGARESSRPRISRTAVAAGPSQRSPVLQDRRSRSGFSRTGARESSRSRISRTAVAGGPGPRSPVPEDRRSRARGCQAPPRRRNPRAATIGMSRVMFFTKKGKNASPDGRDRPTELVLDVSGPAAASGNAAGDNVKTIFSPT